jgi:TfoX/Sxy family transcriptional regulator of competence genes
VTAQTGPPAGWVADWWTRVAAEVSAAHADVHPTRMFGSAGLKAGGKTFAMVVKDRLVVKLPRDRAEHLVGTGAAQWFDPGHGRLMRQWISLAPADPGACRVLVTEALAFVLPPR